MKFPIYVWIKIERGHIGATNSSKKYEPGFNQLKPYFMMLYEWCEASGCGMKSLVKKKKNLLKTHFTASISLKAFALTQHLLQADKKRHLQRILLEKIVQLS